MLTAFVIGSVLSFLSYLVYRLPDNKSEQKKVDCYVDKNGILRQRVEFLDNKKAA